DIIAHFATCASLPDLDTLWENAQILVRRYASQEAFHQALSRDLSDSASEGMKTPRGTPWTAPIDINPDEPMPDSPSVHTEAADFSGDRTLANECLFLQDMGWWVIASHAAPDGEIGRLWEIMKIWIFCFSGSSNRNYASYLLETYCLHWYEASEDFSHAMLDNWLVNLSGKKYSECDYNQEWFNNWLEELFQQLLRMHKEDELHSFRPGRTLGYAAVNYFGQGYERLEDGRMDYFIQQSTAYSDIMIDVLQSADPPEPTA
ncbi:hypothetical protein B0H14DRAFT_2208379, partial [Mycena olivaceomarginata]